MATLAIVLLVIGMLLICAEMFIPGFGVCGITGIIILIVSAIFVIKFIPYGIFIVAAEVIVISVAAVLIIKYVRKHQLYGKLILDETLDVEQREFFDLERFMGKEGITKTSLRPLGIVDFNGVNVEAYSDGAYIPENTKVKTVNVSERKIMVKIVRENEN